jgi:hypothetical protein
MRCDQYIGLNLWARNFLSGEVKYEDSVVRHYPDGAVKKFKTTGTERVVTKVSNGKFTGMYDSEYDLYKYTLPSGEIYREFVQFENWNSGPMFFIALRDTGGAEVSKSLWTEKEVRSY